MNKAASELEERCALLAEKVIDLVKIIKLNSINKSIIEQLIKSSSSIGANYCEAEEAESRKDFIHKLCISKKEIRETTHWLRLLAKAETSLIDKIRLIWQETQELLLIFSKIIITTKENDGRNNVD